MLLHAPRSTMSHLHAQVNWPPSEGVKYCQNANVEVTTAEGEVDFPRDTSGFAAAGPTLLFSRPPSLAGIQIGVWSPADAMVDLFEGCWDTNGNFVRLELLFDEFHNPPGTVGLVNFTYTPFQYGTDPIYGWIDIDIDANINTGGETNNVDRRYTGNIARFGGLPTIPLANRVARSGQDNDNNPFTTPPVERSGEDFHLALFGDLTQSIEHRLGDNDNQFEPNESWILTGHYLHRSHAYENFSSANGDGSYEPLCQLEFRHFPTFAATRITLVYPLNPAGSAEQAGIDVVNIPIDSDATNDNSLAEAMLDLVDVVNQLPPGSPLFNDAFFNLMAPWGNANPNQFLDPTTWDITALVGTAYPQQDFFGALVAWTDAYPRPMLGDLNGDGDISPADVIAFNARLQFIDGQFPFDVDNNINGTVTLPNFGPNFDLLDLDYNGIIDDADRQMIVILGDLNADFLVNELDVAALVAILLDPTAASSLCPDTSEFGACCLFNDGFDVCTETNSNTCTSQGGLFQGTGTNCSIDGCPLSLGACCVPPGAFQSDCVDLTPNDCAIFNGIFLGPDTSCATHQVACNPSGPIGACCLNIGSLPPCAQITAADCQTLGGVYRGDNTGCNPFTGDCPLGGDPNSPGACCLNSPTGVTCQITNANNCDVDGGVFLGPNTTCNNQNCSGPASPPVACCLGGAQCVDTNLLSCIAQNGIPIAIGVGCDELAASTLLPRADLNGDGAINGLDIQVMVHILITH